MLQAGARLGALEVLGPLGAGGMGEVYRARDTRLGRDVAVKILPAAFARDDGRLARLEREARLLAALNHPGIAAIYGLEQSEGSPLLVLELVEGPTLAERLRRGPLPLKETLAIGRQIAEALEAAHERGIIHRDLKPSNIKLTPRGAVKLLDFGLARTLEREGAGADLSKESTDTSPSRLGGILGTAPYMSPEQARGQVADRRADVWAFGCVLYEMLTGRRAFPGATVSDTVAAVLEHEPDWAGLPESTPAAVSTLIRRCLRKDRERRLHDIGDARIELDDLVGDPNAATAVARRERWPARWRAATTLSALTILATILVVGLRRGGPSNPGTAETQRFNLDVGALRILRPAGGPTVLALSPQGHRVAFTAMDPQRRQWQLHLRAIDQLDASVIPGTEDGVSPFFSPDGRWLAFTANDKLSKVSLDDGTVVTLCAAPGFRGGSWGEDGTIVFSMRGEGLFRVSSDGGRPELVTKPDGSGNELMHRSPQILPGGRAALFTVMKPDGPGRAGIVDLEMGRHRILLEDANYPRYVPTGHVLFTRDRTLMAVPFDLRRLEVSGAAIPVLRGVLDRDDTGTAYFEVSSSGALLFVPEDPKPYERTLAWVDASGATRLVSPIGRLYEDLSLAPDGRRLAINIVDPNEGEDVFVLDVERGSWTRVTQGGTGWEAAWAPDGNLLYVYSGLGKGSLRRVAADGSGEAEMLLDDEAQALAVAPDGRSLLFCRQPSPGQGDIWRLPLEGDRTPQPFLVTEAREGQPAFSPDGRWAAYNSFESRTRQVQVRSYPGGRAKYVVAERASDPVWVAAGLFYLEDFGPEARLMRVPVDTRAGLRFRPAEPVVRLADEWQFPGLTYDVTRQGNVIMLLPDPRERAPLRLVYVPNWLDEMRARLAAERR
jgi:Tol biopolymer transport system component